LTRFDRVWFQRLQLNYDETVSNFAFNFSLRHYSEARAAAAGWIPWIKRKTNSRNVESEETDKKETESESELAGMRPSTLVESRAMWTNRAAKISVGKKSETSNKVANKVGTKTSTGKQSQSSDKGGTETSAGKHKQLESSDGAKTATGKHSESSGGGKSAAAAEATRGTAAAEAEAADPGGWARDSSRSGAAAEEEATDSGGWASDAGRGGRVKRFKTETKVGNALALNPKL